MKLLKMFRRQHFGSFENPAGTLVAVPHFLLLGVGHGQDSQRQDLIDFGAVEKVAGTFGRNLRIVVEDDRRG